MRYSMLPGMRALPVLIALIGLATPAFGASDSELRLPPLELQQAVAMALANNPGIKAANLDVSLQQARRDATALGTPYRLGAELENFAGTDTLSGFDLAETTVLVSKVFELGDKRQYRTAIGDAEVGLARIETTIRELDIAAEVSRRYADLLRRQQEIELASETVAISRRTLDIIARRVTVGRAADAEQATATVSLSRLQLLQQRLGFQLATARVRLCTLWGSTVPEFGIAIGNLFNTASLPSYEQLDARLENNPELMIITARSRVQRAQIRLAEARRRPDIEIAAGVRHLSGPNDMGLVVSIDMPFGSSRRAEPLTREANIDARKTPYTRHERLLELRAALFGLYQLLQASHVEVTALQSTIIPTAEQALRYYERGFELGSYSLLELTAAQERLLSVRGEAIAAASSYHITLIEIDSLLGSISPGGALQ